MHTHVAEAYDALVRSAGELFKDGRGARRGGRHGAPLVVADL
jgi:hypothetical protein